LSWEAPRLIGIKLNETEAGNTPGLTDAHHYPSTLTADNWNS